MSDVWFGNFFWSENSFREGKRRFWRIRIGRTMFKLCLEVNFSSDVLWSKWNSVEYGTTTSASGIWSGFCHDWKISISLIKEFFLENFYDEFRGEKLSTNAWMLFENSMEIFCLAFAITKDFLGFFQRNSSPAVKKFALPKIFQSWQRPDKVKPDFFTILNNFSFFENSRVTS